MLQGSEPGHSTERGIQRHRGWTRALRRDGADCDSLLPLPGARGRWRGGSVTMTPVAGGQSTHQSCGGNGLCPLGWP